MTRGLPLTQFQFSKAGKAPSFPRDAETVVKVPGAEKAKKSHAHVPALDGVRGLAIFLVLLFHFMLLQGNGGVARIIQKTWGLGWAGVDLFFVLSGFLITGILLDAKAKRTDGRTYFKNFYARRTVRIFPLYYAFLVVMLLILPAAMSNYHELFGWIPSGQWPFWTYTYNLFQGHHQTEAIFSHSMGVTWSLCIEEQFYLIWPTIVWFCRPRTLLKVSFGLIVMSIVSRAVVHHLYGYEVFTTQWTFCRMDPLAVGASIAIATRIAPQRLQSLRKLARHLVWIIPIAILAMNLKFGRLLNNPAFLIGGYTLLAILFGSVLLMTITSAPGGLYVAIFSNPLLRLFGRLSYAMYMFNQPIKYALMRYVFKLPTSTSMFTSTGKQMIFLVVATAVTVGAAWVSWHLFEKHFLKVKEWFPMDRPVKLENSSSAGAPMPGAP